MKIQIQSIADIITNSSTEVYTVVDSNTIETIKSIADSLLGKGEADKRFNFKLDWASSDRLDYLDEIEDLYDSFDDTEKEGFNLATLAALLDINRDHIKEEYPDQEIDEDAIKDDSFRQKVYDMIDSWAEGQWPQPQPGLKITAKDPKDSGIASTLSTLPFQWENVGYYS